MSSSAYLAWDEGEGVSGEDWATFCSEHRIRHSPSTIGGNVFYAGDVEFHFGKADNESIEPPNYAEQITVATFHFDAALPDVARFARELWLRHGGRLSADDEIRRLIGRNEEVDMLKADRLRWAFASHADRRSVRDGR